MKILLAVDASPASQTALEAVAKRSWPAGTKVEVLTVVNTLEPWALAVIVEEMKSHAHQLADSAAMHLHLQGLAAEGVVGEGDPKHVILDRAAAMGADLIVVGAHGMTAIEQFFLGSVSKAVLRFAPCSVDIVRDAS